jgi:F0F1-type ATP synthase assembly protein I
MNRLRRGYLDLAPELEQYFVTGHREDVAGLMRTYGTRRTRIPATQYLSSIALLVSVIVALLVGALAGMVADAFELALGAAMVIGLATLTALAALVLTVVRQVNHTWNYYKP